MKYILSLIRASAHAFSIFQHIPADQPDPDLLMLSQSTLNRHDPYCIHGSGQDHCESLGQYNPFFYPLYAVLASP